MNRKEFDRYCIDIMLKEGEKSKCLRRKVGAVVAALHYRDPSWDWSDCILGKGHNRPPHKIPKTECETKGCMRADADSGKRLDRCRAVHADQMAIMAALRDPDVNFIRGSAIYLPATPCFICAKLIIEAQIKEVVYLEQYPDTDAIDMLKQAGVKLRKYEQ